MALTDNLQAFYKLSDLSDSSGNNRTLTNNGNVSFASGKIGNAAVFDGQSYMESNLTEINNDFSVSGWIKPNEINSYTACFGINQYTDGLLFRVGSGVDQLYVFGAWVTVGSFSPEVWTHVLITGSNGIAKAYVNNELAVTVSYDATMGFGATPNFIAGASRHNLEQDLLNGQIDAVGIWNRALTDAEVAELYNNRAGGEVVDGVWTPAPPVLGYVKLGGTSKLSGRVKFGA
jgi:arabinan endo-1,5-alpha-L-arabinosidase